MWVGIVWAELSLDRIFLSQVSSKSLGPAPLLAVESRYESVSSLDPPPVLLPAPPLNHLLDPPPDLRLVFL
ncbi:hypothetical protein Tco_1091759 [Tanacetum coccineum]|uniref:Uncharacterized protein n=1 Tax=Tanacetum coccineum TaxID=301880 RepID=A0ABQ5I7V7_9ASTR